MSGKDEKEWVKLPFCDDMVSFDISTLEGARAATCQAGKGNYRDSEAARRALERWNEHSLEEVAEGTDYEQVYRAFRRAPQGSEADKAALAKLEELKKTSDS